MPNQKVTVSIKGISPLLMHAYPLFEISNIEKKTPEDQAEYAAYRNKDTNTLYVPAAAMQRAAISGASFSKGKRGASLQKVVAACLKISPEQIDLGVEKYSIDMRSVVIKSTKGRIIRYRPRLDDWQCSFELEWDTELLKESEIKKVLDDTGSRIGILDFRPECKGPFGRFIVTKWEMF